MTKIYLASSYARKDEMRGVRDVLVAAGHIVTSSWIDLPDDTVNPGIKNKMMQSAPLRFSGYAEQDASDLCDAHLFIMFTGDEKGKESSGGRHTELGFALALEVIVVIIGPRENVFQCLPGIVNYETWREFCLDLWKGASLLEAEKAVRDIFNDMTRELPGQN